MADRKNGLVWDNGKSPKQVFSNAAERYAGMINDQVYRMAVTQAPSTQDVLQNVGTWDDNQAEGGDMIRVTAFRMGENYTAGMVVWYDLESYRVDHPKEDPDFDWYQKHLEGRTQAEIKAEYDEQKKAYELYTSTVKSLSEGVDDRVVETFQDEARYFWDVLVGTLR